MDERQHYECDFCRDIGVILVFRADRIEGRRCFLCSNFKPVPVLVPGRFNQ